MDAALAFRNNLLNKVDSARHKLWHRTILRRNNTSGVAGVAPYRCRKGRRKYWVAYWADENGVRRQRKFSVLRFGERKTKQLAIAERERKLKAVCAAKRR